MVNTTFDMFFENCNGIKATPHKGVYRPHDTEEKQFCQWLFDTAERFHEEWKSKGIHDYDNYYGYVGDAFVKENFDFISDYYKDVFGCRPHFYAEIFAIVVGLHTDMDTILFWDYRGKDGLFEHLCDEAKRNRERIIEYWGGIR